jgi:CHASE2 domain-containing sensor protein
MSSAGLWSVHMIGFTAWDMATEVPTIQFKPSTAIVALVVSFVLMVVSYFMAMSGILFTPYHFCLYVAITVYDHISASPNI